MKKQVAIGPIQRLSQCHPTISNSYSWIRNQMFLLIHIEIQELWVIITTNTRTQPENFQEILQISRRFPGFPGGKINSSRFSGFPGVLDTRDGPNVRLWHSAEAEGLGRLTERVPNVRPNFGRMLCARMKQRLLLVSALSGQKMS